MLSGAAVASAPTVPSASDPLKLCGGGAIKGSSSAPPTGVLRATLGVAEQQFKDFLRQPDDFRVEAKIADVWRPTRLTFLCAATQ